MNLLYVAHRIPYPPNKGEKIRAFNQIRHLSQNHRVHLACLIDEREDLQYLPVLKQYCASIEAVYRGKITVRFLLLLSLLTKQPLSVLSFYSRELHKRIRVILDSQQIDRIFVFSSAMAVYFSHPSEIPRIIDFVDVDSEKWRIYASHSSFPLSWVYFLEADRLARFEKTVAESFDHSIFVTAREAELLRSRVNKRPISVINTGIDLAYFVPNDADRSSNDSVIVFTGTMDYFPNIDAVIHFCKDIFPIIKAHLPETRFYIVGRNPPRKVRELASLSSVIVTGSVADVRPYLAQASIAVAPLRIARGFPHKLLEAMAMGLPVVGTSETFHGLETQISDGIRIADHPQEFAREVVTLLQQPGLRRQCSLQARRYVERHHTWRDHGATLDALLQNTQKPPVFNSESLC